MVSHPGALRRHDLPGNSAVGGVSRLEARAITRLCAPGPTRAQHTREYPRVPQIAFLTYLETWDAREIAGLVGEGGEGGLKQGDGKDVRGSVRHANRNARYATRYARYASRNVQAKKNKRLRTEKASITEHLTRHVICCVFVMF